MYKINLCVYSLWVLCNFVLTIKDFPGFWVARKSLLTITLFNKEIWSPLICFRIIYSIIADADYVGFFFILGPKFKLDGLNNEFLINKVHTWYLSPYWFSFKLHSWSWSARTWTQIWSPLPCCGSQSGWKGEGIQ